MVHGRDAGDEFQQSGGEVAVDFDDGEGVFTAFFSAGVDTGNVDFEAGQDSGDACKKAGRITVPEQKSFKAAAQRDFGEANFLDYDGAAADGGSEDALGVFVFL